MSKTTKPKLADELPMKFHTCCPHCAEGLEAMVYANDSGLLRMWLKLRFEEGPTITSSKAEKKGRNKRDAKKLQAKAKK